VPDTASVPTRVSGTPSLIQDCPTASRVAPQVYIMGNISLKIPSTTSLKRELLILPIMYPFDGLEPATPGDIPEIRIS
jgi:hypothetical protein